MGSISWTMKQILENWRKYTEDTPREVLSELGLANKEKQTQYDEFIKEASKATGVPFALIKAVILAESNFNPNARTRAHGSPHKNDHALGLMQILESGFRENEWMLYSGEEVVGKNRYNPKINIMTGAKHLKKYINKFWNQKPYMPGVYGIIAYNAGPAKLKGWIKKREKQTGKKGSFRVPQDVKFTETKGYVMKVIKYYKMYKSASPESIEEEAKSKSQQRFMGMVHKCKTEGDCASAEIEKTADSMKSKDVKDFAKTKHKGLPNKVKKK